MDSDFYTSTVTCKVCGVEQTAYSGSADAKAKWDRTEEGLCVLCHQSQKETALRG